MHFLHRKVQNSVDLLSGIYYECAGNGAGVRNPTIEEMKEYLSGNLCRCTGYMGQLRAIRKYMAVKKQSEKEKEVQAWGTEW